MIVRWAKRIEKAVGWVNRFTHSVSLLIIFLLMLLTTSDVVGRYLGHPVRGTFEMTELGLALAVFFSLGYTQLKKEHTEIGVFVDRLPNRARAAIEAAVYLVSLLLVLTATWQLVKYGQLLKNGNNLTIDLLIPVYLLVWCSAIGMFLFALSYAVDFARSLYRMVTNQ